MCIFRWLGGLGKRSVGVLSEKVAKESKVGEETAKMARAPPASKIPVEIITSLK